MKKNLVSTLAIIAAATAVFGMTASADDVKTAEIVLEAENAPYTYEDDNGEPAGYEYEVLKLIDDYLDDWTFNYTVLDYETALAGTTSGKYDLDSGCKFRTPAREEAFLVSNPYNYFFMNLVVKNDSGIKSLEDMDGKSIAPIVATDGRAVALADWMEKHPDIKLDFETLAASGAMADEITSVEDGVYDAAYLSAEQANAILDETGYDDLTVTDRVDGRDTAFLINKDQTELQEAEELLAREDATQAEVDEALEHLKAAEAALVKVTVTLDKTSATIYTGKTVTLKATSNDTAKTVTYTTSNKAVATVSSTGVVKGVKAGTAVITANCGNATATCKVTVKAPYVKFAKKSAVVYKGKTATVKATLAGVSSVTYKSSNTKIATVNSKTGTVKGIKAGTVTITATSGKLKATYKLTVKNPTFTLTKSSATIAKGKTTTIKSKAAPASKVTYISSNRKVATVTSKGVVKGIRKGKATITVKCNGITKKFVVTVK